MKSLVGNADPIRDKILTVHEALTYVLSQPVTTLVSGINNIDQLRKNAAIAAAFSPMSPAALSALESRCLPATETNIYQPYREWMAQRARNAGTFVTGKGRPILNG